LSQPDREHRRVDPRSAYGRPSWDDRPHESRHLL